MTPDNPLRVIPSRETIDDIVKAANEQAKTIEAQVERLAMPVLTVMSDQAKSIVALSSSALVLSVSAAQFASKASASATWLLAASWILLAGTIAAGALRYHYDREVRGYGLNLWAAINNLSESLSQTARTPDEANQEAERILDAVLNATVKALKSLDRSNNAMLIGFTLGMAALVAFAVVNIP